MGPRDLRRTGHWPTMLCAFLYLDLSLLVWAMFGAMGDAFASTFRLGPAERSLLAVVPVLGGIVGLVVVGVLADLKGARRIALYGLGITAFALLLGWLWVNSFAQLLLVGGLLGVAAASVAAALPMASRWYPDEQQGVVLGIVGMGIGGTALASLLAPGLVSLAGWHGVFGLALIPLAVVFGLVALVARDAPGAPEGPRLADRAAVLRQRDTYWYCGLYAVTFGGFVGLPAYLPLFFRDRYGVDPIRAGMFAALCAIVGSLLRPVGGFLSDRLGGILVLFLLFMGVGFLGLRMSYLPHLESATLCLFLMLGLLGMGNGAVFQLVPQRFGEEFGTVSGLVGAAGGLGGFLLPLALVGAQQWTGRFGPGFFVIGLVGFTAAGLLIQASRAWDAEREPASGRSSLGQPIPARERAPALAEVGMETVRRLG